MPERVRVNLNGLEQGMFIRAKDRTKRVRLYRHGGMPECFLTRRFGEDCIYLMGHSGGSFLGMHAVARAPELDHAHISVARMANQLRSEKRADDYMLER
jgi:hypothetical protein